eukprot:COSAG02_NODE_1245_length_13662_cov_4.594338_6_plen_30_part_00
MRNGADGGAHGAAGVLVRTGAGVLLASCS